MQIRTVSTIAAVTAVNVKREIPSAFRKLYESLKALEQKAAVYINVSQLQLALRGLESDNPITRIAVLGLNGHNGARRLTRALLADPLALEQQWEKKLLTDSDDMDERALILRYGEQPEVDDRHPLVKTLSIPSAALHAHNVEIFIQAVSPNIQTYEGAATLLVPSLEASSPSGRLSVMIYPVHKALIYQEGLKALDVFATIGQRDKMVRGVIDWSWSGLQQRNDPSISPINLALGEAAIEAFRQSLRQSVEYEHQWFDAGMPDVSAWVLEGTEAKPGLMKPAIWRLIQLICQNANHAIQQEEASKDGQKRSSTIPTSTRNIIDQRVSIWAENAHTELRDRLYSAFNSKSWRRIKWWKLFWRVDDVGYIVSDILRRTWLVEAEKEMIWISGRIHQSGLLGPPKLRPEPPPPDPDDERTFGRAPPAPGISDLIERPTNFEVVEDMIVQHPWRQDISHARSALLEVTVPPLQSLSQALLLQTISTNVLASSLSALFYVSVSTTSPYEAGAIAALGFVLSLRRLQRRWELARSEWQTQIREEGRRVLRNIEEVAREPIRDGGMGEADVIGIEERATARQAVDKVQKALEETSS